MEDSDQELLRCFASGGDQRAFQFLVQRHLGMVHAVARRVTGSGDLARDVVQNTFIRLARQAATLASRPVPLAAWLHRTCHSLAIDLVRAETRRRRREEKAFRDPLATMDDTRTESGWEQITPVLDELINRLPARDRELLLLRYYENRSHAVIAGTLGLSEQVARMRCLRALEKLRTLLQRRGIATSSAALSSLLPAHGGGTASPALTAAVLQATQGITPLAPGVLSRLLTSALSHRSALAALAVMFCTATLVVELFPPPTPLTGTADATLPQASSLRRPHPTNPWTAVDALEMLQAVDTQRSPAPPMMHLADVLRDWTVPELRTALEEALCSPGLALPDRASDETLQLLVQAWLQRDISGFFAWRDSLSNESRKDLLTEIATSQWPADKGSEALAYAMEYPETFPEHGTSWDAKAMSMALTGSVKRGPAAVAECLAIALKNHLRLPEGLAELPRDFDFKALIATPEAAGIWNYSNTGMSFQHSSGALTFLLNSWWQKDRDEAFDTLLARGRELNSLPGNYFYPFPSAAPTEEQASWLAGKMTEMTPQERHDVWDGNRLLLISQPQALDRLITAMADRPQDVRQLHEIGASALPNCGVAAVLPHLEALGGPAERIAYLETATFITEGTSFIVGLKDSGNRELLRSKLEEWNATPEQIETITSRIHFRS